jgi:hypothetical protein
VKYCEVKGLDVELIINCSSPGTQRFVHGGFRMVKDIFAKAQFVEIRVDYLCVEYLYE